MVISSSASISIGLLIVSDSVASNSRNDATKNAFEESLEELNNSLYTLSSYRITPDDTSHIRRNLYQLDDELPSHSIKVIITSGGTGIASRDVTPEAIEPLLTKRLTSLEIALTVESLKATPFAALARPVCGLFSERTVVCALPGSPKAVRQLVGIIFKLIPHIANLLDDNKAKIERDHASSAQTCGCMEPSSVTNEAAVQLKLVQATPVIELQLEKLAQKSLSAVSPITDTEQVSTSKSAYRVLALASHSKVNIPGFVTSTRDGFIIANDAQLPGEFIVKGDIAAGRVSSVNHCPELEGNQCYSINTGCALVCSTSFFIVMREYAREIGDNTVYLDPPTDSMPYVDQYVRGIGSDIAKNAHLLFQGTRIDPAKGHIGLLTSCGVSSVTVYARPKVSIIITGSEVNPNADAALEDGLVFDAHGLNLFNILTKSTPAAVSEPLYVDDDVSVLEEQLKKALPDTDIVITTGGISMGNKDVVKTLLQTAFDSEYVVQSLPMRPGHPFVFAKIHGYGKPKYLFALPGNPLSALITTRLFLIPSILKISGVEKVAAFPRHKAIRQGELARFHLKSQSMCQWVPVKLTQGSEMLPFANAINSRDSVSPLPMSSNPDGFANADALLLLESTSQLVCSIILF